MSDLVSIIMLSRNMAPYVEETVRSVMAQTYRNWELLFIDDNSQDDTIGVMQDLKEEERRRRNGDDRITVMRTAYTSGESVNRNSALKSAKGRWVAFLNVGSVWHPEKLEKQIAFMEEHGYAFSYTKYGLMDLESKDRGIVIGGKEHATHKDLLKCCWPAYLTVMYDREKVGLIQARIKHHNNDYALWLDVSDRNDLYLLPENLATMRTKWNVLGNLLLTNKAKWRYECYRQQEDLGPVTSFLYTLRNALYGIVKWLKYVKKNTNVYASNDHYPILP